MFPHFLSSHHLAGLDSGPCAELHRTQITKPPRKSVFLDRGVGKGDLCKVRVCRGYAISWRFFWLCHFFFLLFLFPSPATKGTEVTELQHRSSKPSIVNLDKRLSFWRTRRTWVGHERLWHEEQKMLYVNYISIKLRDNV